MSQWQPIETAPKDGQAVLLLSVPYALAAGPNGVHQIPAKVAIGHWFAEGTSWVPEGPHPDSNIYLAKTGVWLSGGGWFQPDEVSHWMPLPPPPVDQLPAEPDMSRMGDKHIKPCKGCGTPLLWAKHEKTLKVAPLVKAKPGEKPNIMAYYDEGQDQWFYKIKGAKSEVRGTAEYLNHFSNCSHANDFRSQPLSEQEQTQNAIK